VFRDVTDKYLAKPEASEILTFFNLSDGGNWNGAIFRFSDLSDVSYNKSLEVRIDPANPWFSNEIERQKQIESFDNAASTILNDAEKDSIGRNNSSIYLPIAGELNRLSQSKAQKRILIIYSDLMDNDLDVSLYSKNEFRELEQNPQSLRSVFEARQQLGDLTGIEVHFIYQPADVLQDKEYRIVSAFYQKLLEDKGASVTIEANL